MTEDDTFNKLKRKPLNEVIREWGKSPKYGTYALYCHVTSYYWTLQEFLDYYYADIQGGKAFAASYMGKFREELSQDYGIQI